MKSNLLSRSLNTLLAIALRILSVEMVRNVRSGHLGAPMGMAEIVCALYFYSLRHNPLDPNWWNRDRVVLSNGHCSALLYSALQLVGYKLFTEDLETFRMFNSITPGHPEYGITPGVEATTGPLGQGLANAVGMALAEELLSTEFNYLNYRIIDHKTYALVGDGCLMEGISHEVCSLAGALQLKKLIVLFDSNDVSIDGSTKLCCNDDVQLRFRSYHWNVTQCYEGHSLYSILNAVRALRGSTQPNIIIAKTIIGKGYVPKQGTAYMHGTLSNANNYDSIRKYYGWNSRAFKVPPILNALKGNKTTISLTEKQWHHLFLKYFLRFPMRAAELKRRLEGRQPRNWFCAIKKLIRFAAKSEKDLSTRQASQQIVQQIASSIPELLGGSADLTHSNLTSWSGHRPVVAGRWDVSGNYIHYGIREFGMSAIMNGIALHGGFKVYGGTFLVFSDYSKSAIRLSALSNIPTVFIFTHDSIAVGEDGPTHQPIEQISSLRLIPNHTVWRPSSILECAVSWLKALQSSKPTSLILSRQCFKRMQYYHSASIKDVARGGYIVKDWDNSHPKRLILVFTGSELQLATELMLNLSDAKISIRLVSMPSCCLYNVQCASYRNSVLPEDYTKVFIEVGRTNEWHKFVGRKGLILGADGFGRSGEVIKLLRHFGLDVRTATRKIHRLFTDVNKSF